MTLAKFAAVMALWACSGVADLPHPAPAAADPTVQQLNPSLPSTPQRDDAFLSALADAGLRVVDVRTAIAGGHDVCAYMSAGHVALEAVQQGMRNNPTVTRQQQILYTNAAISTYCPRQTGLNTLA